MSAVKVAFLYTEVAGYFLSCAAELSKCAEVVIFRWPVNKEAPFDLSKYDRLQLKDRSEYSQDALEKELKDFNPSIIVCSGWIDKGYVKAARSFKKKIPVILSLDNHWTGSLKQKLVTATSALHLKKTFTHAWVPGHPQAIYAKKLGFDHDLLLLNFYCADSELFKKIYDQTFSEKEKQFPKKFLYVARYVEHKGIFEMWQAFKELKAELNSDWELICLGTGDEWKNRVEGEGITHVGFVQPEDMQQYIKESGVYILPSKFEPWGVSVQEFAISGFPLLLSEAIGAKWTYLKEGQNGFEFQSGSVEAIKKAMKQIMEMDDEKLIQMGRESHALGMSFTPKKWVDNLLSILDKWKS